MAKEPQDTLGKLLRDEISDQMDGIRWWLEDRARDLRRHTNGIRMNFNDRVQGVKFLCQDAYWTICENRATAALATIFKKKSAYDPVEISPGVTVIPPVPRRLKTPECFMREMSERNKPEPVDAEFEDVLPVIPAYKP